MYFIRYQPLKEKLRTRTLSDTEALPYFIAFLAFYTLLFAFPAEHELNVWDVVSGLISLTLVIAGTIYLYHKNGGASGQDFIHKYVVLGWIVGWRCTLLFLPLFLIRYICLPLLVPDLLPEETHPADVCTQLAFELVLYGRFGHHIQDIGVNGGNS